MNYEALDKKRNKIKHLLNKSHLYRKEYLDYINVKLTYHSNAIEGNTLTEAETALVIEKGIAVGGKTLREHNEAINHFNAFNYIMQRSLNKEPILEEDILKIHSYVLNHIDDEKKGVYRNLNVRVLGSNSIFPNYAKVPSLMEGLNNFLKDNQSLHTIELAKEAHYKLVSIHPFIDGNGRTARLLMNSILIQGKYPPLIIEKEDRLEYINALEAKQVKENSKPWDDFVYKAIDKSLDYFTELAKEVDVKKNKGLER